MITTSFADAMKADGFHEMAEFKFWPYGNAETKKEEQGWSFTCQHGSIECQYNQLETCAQFFVQSPIQFFNFLNCVENLDVLDDYEGVARQCATEALIDNLVDDILECTNGAFG